MFVSYLPFKFAPLPSHTFFLLVVSSSLAREFVTSSFVVLLFLIAFTLLISQSYLGDYAMFVIKNLQSPTLVQAWSLISPVVISYTLPLTRPILSLFLIVPRFLVFYAHLPPLLHPCPLSPLNPRDTYALAHMLILNLPF